MRFVYLLSFLLLWIAPLNILAQEEMLSIQELQDSMENDPKPVLLLLHTDWCSYCALQKKQLGKRKNKLKDVYVASFDAESNDDINFKGRIYEYLPHGNRSGIHALALKLMGEKSKGYPTWVLLDREMNVVEHYAGYLKPKELDFIAKQLVMRE